MAALDDPDFNHLPRPVAALFARAAARSFFALPIWYHVLARYGTDKGDVPRLYVDGAARGALACRMPRPGARRLGGLANYYSTEHGPIYGDAAALPQALDEIAREISADGIEAVRLPGLDPADPGFAALESAFRRTGFAVHRYFDSGTWFENTAGMDFDRYVAARGFELAVLTLPGVAQAGRAGRDVAVEIHACGVLEPGAAVEIAVHGEAGAAERGFQRGEARIGRIEPGETNRLDAVGGYFARDLVKRLR